MCMLAKEQQWLAWVTILTLLAPSVWKDPLAGDAENLVQWD